MMVWKTCLTHKNDTVFVPCCGEQNKGPVQPKRNRAQVA